MAGSNKGTQVLAPQMRQALSEFSTRLFSSNKTKYDNLHAQLPGNEVLTSLSMQMSMYFNVYLFPFWLITNCVMLEAKYQYLEGTFRVILIAILILYTFVEIIRLYLGYMGNLHEKVPELAGCVLLSIPQIILLVITVAHPLAKPLPMDGAMNVILLALVVAEFISGLFALSAMSKQEASKFRLQQFVDLENINTLFEDPNHPQTLGRYS